MNYLIIFSHFLIFLSPLTAKTIIHGIVELPQKEAMVWLSTNEKSTGKDLLISHTLVPQKGSYEFSVNPGIYRIVASDEAGNMLKKEITIKKDQKIEVSFKK